MILSKNAALMIVCVLLPLYGMSQEAKLAEDPYEVNKIDYQQEADQPWINRSPEELRLWAKENLHHKLTAKKVIDAGAHPEWDWFREVGLGLFIHWGLPSANPGSGDAWSIIWSEKKEKANRYMEPAEKMFAVAETWNPNKYNPDKWLEAAKRAGFGYSVLTTRHHDGYALWPSEYGGWDTGEYMDGRDLVKEYVDASRKHKMRVGFYYSGPNWHSDYKKRDFGFPENEGYSVNYKHEKVDKDLNLIPTMRSAGPDEDRESKGQVRELMSNYGSIDVIWWDGRVAMKEEELRPMQPKVFVARGNIATPEGKHQATSENLKVTNESGWWWEQCRKAENTATPNWHYGVESENNHWGTNTLLTELIRCRALGGNLLVNIPPRGNGEMMDWFYEVCEEMEGWMKHSQEAVYGVNLDAPLPTLDQTTNYTTKKDNVFYTLPTIKNMIAIKEIDAPISITLLRTGENLKYTYLEQERTISVKVPEALTTDLPDIVKIVFEKKND